MTFFCVCVCLCVLLRVLVNVNRNFLDAANKEKMREREALESGLMFSRDRLFEMVAVRSCCFRIIVILYQLIFHGDTLPAYVSW